MRRLAALAALLLGLSAGAVEDTLHLRVALNNPFNPDSGQTTRIDFTRRDTDGDVTVSVYAVDGRRVKTLTRRFVTAGTLESAGWDGRDEDGVTVAAGVYFVVLESAAERLVRRVAVLRE